MKILKLLNHWLIRPLLTLCRLKSIYHFEPYQLDKIKQPALDLISNQINVELLEKPAREQLSIMQSA